jgi:hypothetical protein
MQSGLAAEEIRRKPEPAQPKMDNYNYLVREIWFAIDKMEVKAWRDYMDSHGCFFPPSKAKRARHKAITDIQDLILKLWK